MTHRSSGCAGRVPRAGRTDVAAATAVLVEGLGLARFVCLHVHLISVD
jgi:hypothetical protein